MSNKLQPVRGTHDILPDEFEKFSAVVNTARNLATLYGFREMATPIFEATEVFSRSMGETSDVVSKEMFTFETRGGESVTLRPEFTAGIARAFISNGMQQNLPLKLFSTGPLFRYERPQKGRQRQFHQVNFEWLGDDSWMADVEVITLAGHLLYSLSGGKGCTLHINTLGDKESREKYRDTLVRYLTPFADKLSEDSKRRLNENPLRILDSKDHGDRQILANAPVMTEYLSDAAKKRFKAICGVLQNKKNPIFQEIIIDPTLVRGLDYYSGVVFEFVANTGELGAQKTVLAGGRYDGLIEQIGGKPTPAIGFAAGIERLLLLNIEDKSSLDLNLNIAVIPHEGAMSYWYDDNLVDVVFESVIKMRMQLQTMLLEARDKRYLNIEIDWQGTVKKRMERADKKGVSYVISMTKDENKNIAVILRDMKKREDKNIILENLSDKQKLKEIFGIN